MHDSEECGGQLQPPAKRPPCFEQSWQDIPNYTAHSSTNRTDDKKYQLIVDHLVLDATYKFLKAANRCSCQYALARYRWLRCSKKADDGFYLPCVCVSKLWVFFSSHPKQQTKLEEVMETTQLEAKIHKLKDLCCTQWISKLIWTGLFSSAISTHSAYGVNLSQRVYIACGCFSFLWTQELSFWPSPQAFLVL